MNTRGSMIEKSQKSENALNVAPTASAPCLKRKRIMPEEHKLLINSRWVSGEKKLEVRNPYNQEFLAWHSSRSH